MKNLITALTLFSFLLISKVSQAQNSDYITNLNNADSIGVDSLVNLIVKGTGKNFKFDSRQSKYNLVGYVYRSPDQDNDPLVLSLYSSQVGENKDLGIKGSTTYSLKSITGRFLDLYPFWKAYFSDKLTPEELTKAGETISIPDGLKKARLRRQQNLVWSIDVK